MKRTIAFIAIVATCLILISQVARAEEEGNKFVNFLKKVFVYPFRTAEETAEVVTETTTRSVGTVAKTGEAAVGVATGDVKKVKDVVVEPIKGSAETAGTTIKSSVMIPVEAAEEKEVPTE